jgi:hypothetical protein
MIFVQLCTSKITEPPDAVTNANKTWLNALDDSGYAFSLLLALIYDAPTQNVVWLWSTDKVPDSQSVILVILKIASPEKIVLVKR